jgi:hypothetical protein
MTGKVKDRKLVKGDSVKQFFEAIRSNYTRSSYERRLITFLTIIHMPVDEFVGLAWATGSKSGTRTSGTLSSEK